MATEEQTNKDLISVLAASNIQPSVHGTQALVLVMLACIVQPSSKVLIVRPPAPNAVTTAGVTGNPPTQATISTVAHAYPATNVKIQSILKKLDDPSISDEGSLGVSSLVPNAQILEVNLTSALDTEASNNDPRTELDSHANMVVL